MSAERLYEFDIVVNGTRKLKYATRATSEAEARERAEQFARRMKSYSLTTPRGADPNGLYLSR
jgi:hypothetical protein